ECAMLRLSVLLSQNRERAVVEKILPLDSPDAELVELAERTARPLVVKTDLFGDLTLDRTLDRFEGRAEWNGRSIAVSFPRDENREIAGGLRTAEKLWADQIAWKQRVEDYAIAELLELKNENWLNDDEPPVTADEFKSRMTLTSITIENGGHLDFWHSDGDLFWGHSILVSGTLENGLIHADIPG
ncbi:MAG TPA: DUF2262 domain-containing protein, partial [Pirellulales bacterium]